MHRTTPRRLLTAALALAATWAVTAPGEASAQTQNGSSAGSRYRILVPALEVQGGNARAGEAIARDLRAMVDDMATHISVPAREMQNAVRQFRVAEMNEITARQLAQQMDAQLVMWGTVTPGGQGLQANVTFTDTRTGDQIVLERVEGNNTRTLAQAVFTGFQQQIEGLRMAVFCNDYLASSDYDRALDLCDRALAVVPNSPTAMYGRAAALMQLERDEEALEAFQALLRIDPLHENALMGEGFVASRMGRNDLALQAYTRYLELNPDDPGVRMRVAGESAKAGDVVTAFRILQPGIAENQDDADFQKYLLQVAAGAGQKAREQQNTAEMQEYFTAAVAAYNRLRTLPEAEMDESVFRAVISAQTLLGNRDEALRTLEEALGRFGESAAMYALAGATYSELGRHAEAVRALQRVAQIDPQYENIWIRLAMAQLDAGQRDAAMPNLERAVSQGNRDNVVAVIQNLGGQALNANRFQDAARYFDLAAGYATGARQTELRVFQGVAVYREAEAIARANGAGACAPAQRALPLFQQALRLVGNAQTQAAGQVRNAAQQYVENQQAIIQSACRR
jgi:tetratricopeptide (TPR) repeat protein